MWALTCSFASWTLLGSNQRPLPCKCWQTQRRYLGKRHGCLVEQCLRVPVSDGSFRLVLVRLGSKWGLRWTCRGAASDGWPFFCPWFSPPSGNHEPPCAQPPRRSHLLLLPGAL